MLTTIVASTQNTIHAAVAQKMYSTTLSCVGSNTVVLHWPNVCISKVSLSF